MKGRARRSRREDGNHDEAVTPRRQLRGRCSILLIASCRRLLGGLRGSKQHSAATAWRGCSTHQVGASLLLPKHRGIPRSAQAVRAKANARRSGSARPRANALPPVSRGYHAGSAHTVAVRVEASGHRTSACPTSNRHRSITTRMNSLGRVPESALRLDSVITMCHEVTQPHHACSMALRRATCVVVVFAIMSSSQW
jgi:hypothetical protein